MLVILSNGLHNSVYHQNTEEQCVKRDNENK